MYVFKERDMMLRRLLLLSCIGFIGTIGVSQAIDVNIPGARQILGKKRIKNIVFKEKLLRRLMTSKSLRLKNGHNMSQIMIMKN